MNIKHLLLGLVVWLIAGSAGFAAAVDRQAALDAVVADRARLRQGGGG